MSQVRTSERLRIGLAITVLLGGGCFIAAWVVIWLLRGSYLTSAVALGAVVLCVSFACQMAYVLSGAPKPRTEYSPEGTKVRPPKCVDLMFTVGLTAGVAAAAMYLVSAPYGKIDYVPSGVLHIALPAGCVFYVLFGAPTLYRVFKHRASGCLRLDPYGFDVWNGQWGKFVHAGWADVEQILDRPIRGRKPLHEVIVFALPKGRSAMLVSDTITANSDALREWVRFYWQHPEYRAELTDGRALKRLDEERFGTE